MKPRSSRYGRRLYTRRMGPMRPPSVVRDVFANNVNTDETLCVDCGWPLSVVPGSVRVKNTTKGDTQYTHYLCPSLSERAKLRKAAQEQS